VTVVVFLITGTVVGLAELGVLFREALMVGAPAVIGTLLVDTFLYNEFLIRTGRGFWVILYGFLFVQSGLVAASIVSLVRYVSRRDRLPCLVEQSRDDNCEDTDQNGPK
jgi:hypothetical protein